MKGTCVHPVMMGGRSSSEPFYKDINPVRSAGPASYNGNTRKLHFKIQTSVGYKIRIMPVAFNLHLQINLMAELFRLMLAPMSIIQGSFPSPLTLIFFFNRLSHLYLRDMKGARIQVVSRKCHREGVRCTCQRHPQTQVSSTSNARQFFLYESYIIDQHYLIIKIMFSIL